MHRAGAQASFRFSASVTSLMGSDEHKVLRGRTGCSAAVLKEAIQRGGHWLSPSDLPVLVWRKVD